MELEYWQDELNRRYVELDKAIKEANARFEEKVKPYRDKYTRVIAEAQKQVDSDIGPYIAQYEEWQKTRPDEPEAEQDGD